jgi:hypothetical protein
MVRSKMRKSKRIVQKPKTAKATTSTKPTIYAYFGHGQDICIDRRLDLQRVPNHCAYISTVQCGYSAYLPNQQKE